MFYFIKFSTSKHIHCFCENGDLEKIHYYALHLAGEYSDTSQELAMAQELHILAISSRVQYFWTLNDICYLIENTELQCRKTKGPTYKKYFIKCTHISFVLLCYSKKNTYFLSLHTFTIKVTKS